MDQRLSPSVLACLGVLILKNSSGAVLPGGGSSHCCHVQLPWSGAQRVTPASALGSWVLQDDFPCIPKVRLTCSVARLARIKSPGDGTRLGSCSIAAHRGEYFETAHSLFRLRECSGSYYLFCLSNCFFPSFDFHSGAYDLLMSLWANSLK